ncbi:MAG: hypothetical protein ACYDHZ_00850 [Dehalococcoidia bacterium]
MKLTPEEEKIFDERYQAIIEANDQYKDWFIDHKKEIKEVVERMEDIFARL